MAMGASAHFMLSHSSSTICEVELLLSEEKKISFGVFLFCIVRIVQDVHCTLVQSRLD